MTEKESHMTENPWLNQPKIGPYPEQGVKKRPTLRIDFGYVCEEVDYHTCGYSNPHEPDCGLIPICDVDAAELSDMERDLISALVKAQAELAEAERRGAERGWDEGRVAGAAYEGALCALWYAEDTNGEDPDPIENPYRSQSPSATTTAPPEPAQPASDHRDTPEPCECYDCDKAWWGRRMYVCGACGSKRCPRAMNHTNPCTKESE
jgi:hypothetical protein